MVRKVLLYILYVVLVVALALIIINALGAGDNNGSKKASKPHSSSSKSIKNRASDKSSKPNSSSDSSTSVPGANMPAQAGHTAATDLANTGPGEVVALFAGVTVVGAATFSWHQRRRLVS